MHYYKIFLISSPLGEFTYKSKKKLKLGTIVDVNVKKRELRGIVIFICQEPDFQTNEILNISEFYFSNKQMELAKFISIYYICSLGDAFGVMTPFMDEIPNDRSNPIVGQVWNDEGGIACQAEEDNSSSFLGLTQKSSLKLSKKQEDTLSFLKQHKISLLFGDTSSGKTEIYMKYFQDILATNKRSIFLMPEISLTPQMGIRLQEHFEDRVVMYHSKLTPKQKREALQKIRSGEAKIIAGPRSTLFLPIKNLGLIVVDEEHDDSYKSSSRPRYNARDLAIYMGKLHNIPVVLGSATPSLSSFVKFPYFRLKGGFFNSNREFMYEKSAECLSALILDSLKATLDKKEQSIVFIPTRANFKHLICNDCGHHYECVFCSIGMSIHNKSNALKCHYCNYTQALPQRCCSCGSDSLVSSRLGTAEAVKNLNEEFNDANIEQFDRDTITTTSKLKKALKRFNEKQTDILIGTQMLSKGHDYHGVTLAVVLGMDNMLNMSHYASREKALSSLLQIAGRSGRKKDAKVLVQSFNEGFFKTYLDNYEEFLEDEKEFRKELYPPYKKLCRVLFSHKNGAKARESMEIMREKLLIFKEIEVVGYGKCAIERISNKYRFEILLRADKSTKLIEAIMSSKDMLCEIDMDPIEFG
ncbi:MAG: primosomal protein N' [Sulfurimonas sp.]|nr:primosomal protein N' [Sulfurimonas sp.]